MIIIDVNEPEKVIEKFEEKNIPYIQTQIRIYYCKTCGKVFGLEEPNDPCDCNETISVRIGDFMDSDHRWVVERKSMGDFVNSMRDKSLHVQAANMAKLFKGQKYVFLEGFISIMAEDPRNIKIRPWIRSMRSTLAQYNIPLWQMDDLNMLVYELEKLDEKCGQLPMIYDKIDDKYSGGSIQKKMVCKLIDVSDKKAQILLNKIGSPFEIFNAIIKSQVIYTRTGNPKGIIGPLEGIKGFGHKFVTKNKEMLLTYNGEKKAKKMDKNTKG